MNTMEGLTSFVCGSFDASRPSGDAEDEDKLDVGMESPPPQLTTAPLPPQSVQKSSTQPASPRYDAVLPIGTARPVGELVATTAVAERHIALENNLADRLQPVAGR